MTLENVGAAAPNCARGNAVVTMTSAEAELDQEAVANALSSAGNYTLKSMTKIEAE